MKSFVPSPMLVWYGPLHLAFPGDVADTCTNIQQVAVAAAA